MKRYALLALLLVSTNAAATDRTITYRIEPLVPITTGIREARPYQPAPTRAWTKPEAGVYSVRGIAPANGCEGQGGFRVISGLDRGCFGTD